jgi:periplasmic protein TonB
MSAVTFSGARGYDGDNRAFSYAILCSIVLHGLLLLALPSLRDSSRRADAHPGPIIARLSPPQTAAPSPPRSEPQPAPPVEEKAPPPPPPVVKPAPAPKPVPLAKAPKPPAKPTPVAPAPPAPRAAPAETPPAPTASTAPPAPAPARVESAPAAPAASSPSIETPDAGTLAQYRLQLISVAKRYKRYPRVAMDNNWEGTAEIRMVIGANGMIASLVVRKGSGHDILDKEALDWLRKAKPLAPIPAALRGKEFTVDIPVIFNLKEPGA